MTELVIDASALTFSLASRTSRASRVRDRLREAVCHAPHLIDAELGNVLRRLVRVGEVAAENAVAALDAASDVIDIRHGHAGALAQEAWLLRENLSFYDALYVALAARLGVPLVTGDVRLSRAPALPCAVELV